MAKITNIPDTDNVLRYAKKTHLAWELDLNGNPVKVTGCFPDLFKLRDNPDFNKNHGGPEKYLSINWVEFFEGDEECRLQQTVNDFRSSRKIKKSDAFAKLNAGEFKSVCMARAAKVRIIHDAKESLRNKSHGRITQLPQDDALLFDDLCEMALNALIPVSRFIT